MSERDDESLAAAVAAVETVPAPSDHPIPNFRASADDVVSTPADQPSRKRRLIGGNPKPQPGTRDNAPRSQRAPKAEKESKPLPPIPPGGFAPAVEKMYATIALGLMPIDMQVATTLMQIAPDAAKAWDELARRNHAVRRILVGMMQTTAVGALFAAHVPIIMLLVGRAMGDNPRMSMLANMLGNEAEEYANGSEDAA